jgi:DNA-binding transcriptional ArsR family regulator
MTIENSCIGMKPVILFDHDRTTRRRSRDVTMGTKPRVRDLTEARRGLAVEILSAPAFEILAHVFVFMTGRDEPGGYGVGPAWFNRVAEAAGPDLAKRLEAVSCCGEAWLGLLGEAYDAPGERTVEDLLAVIRGSDGEELRERVVSMLRRELPDMSSEQRELLRSLEERDAGAVPAMLADLLEEYDRRVFHGGAETAGVLARDAEEKRAMARSMTPERLVEQATNGITFSAAADLTGVVLIPSVAMRPWVTITEHRGLRMFQYGVSEEVLSADPLAPPAWLVGFYTALADERRLQILRLLRDGSLSFAELTERLGLAKSTVHHHIRTLRGASLIRVIVGDEHRYELRTDAVPEAGRLLEGYLAGPETEGTSR